MKCEITFQNKQPIPYPSHGFSRVNKACSSTPARCHPHRLYLLWLCVDIAMLCYFDFKLKLSVNISVLYGKKKLALLIQKGPRKSKTFLPGTPRGVQTYKSLLVFRIRNGMILILCLSGPKWLFKLQIRDLISCSTSGSLSALHLLQWLAFWQVLIVADLSIRSPYLENR